jgi:hypothetical protein
MKAQFAFRKFLLGVSLATAANCVSAAFVNFVEDNPSEESPFSVETNLLGFNYTVGNDGVTFDGYHTPVISPIYLPDTTYVGGLLEPGVPGIVSDLVVLTASDIDPVTFWQNIHIEVFSDDRSLTDVITMYPFVSVSNFLLEDGTLQDISSVMGSESQLAQDEGGTTLPFGDEGIRVSIQSSIPEPGSLILFGTGLVALRARRRQAASA